MFGIEPIPQRPLRRGNVKDMGTETVEMGGEKVLDDIKHELGEVHNSSVPLEISLGIALTLAGLLIWPSLIFGLVLTVHAIYRWITEDAAMWEDRPTPKADEWGHASWAMIWIILTEAIIFASFFAFWFWARWHTVNWENAVGGSWPADGIEHNMFLVTVYTLILLTSGFTGHKA